MKIYSTKLITNSIDLNNCIDFFLDGLADKTDIETIKNYTQKNVDCTESISIKGYGPNNIAKDDQYLYLASTFATPLLDILKMPLSVRVYKCTACGLELPRDLNSARSIKRLGLESLETEVS